MLKKKVLVNGISNLSDARYCAGMGVEYLCFELNEEHEDYISIDKITEIKKWVSGVKIGGRLSQCPENVSGEQWEALGLDFLLLAEDSLGVAAQTKVNELILETELDALQNIELSNFEHVLVLCNTPSEIENIGHSSVFMGYAMKEGSVGDFLENEAIIGLALRGSQEPRPGYSNYDELMDVLEALEED